MIGAAIDRQGSAVRPCTTAVHTLACVVTYQPDPAQLYALARSLSAAAGLRALFIDNSENEVGADATDDVARRLDIAVLRNAENRGVGAAYNAAVDVARSLGCTRLLLLDQDSSIVPESIAALQAALDRLLATGTPVAAVGPVFVDPRSGRRSPFVRLGRGIRMRHVECGSDDVVECDLLISSGSLIPLSAFDLVGPHDASLFIDYVDVEWCARARNAGLKIFGVPAAVMHHSVGESAVWRMGRWMPLHTPIRQYYLARNALLFARKPYLPMNWRIHLLTRALAQFVIYAGTCAPRWQRARWLGLGLVHGLVGRSGRLPRPATVRPLAHARRLGADGLQSPAVEQRDVSAPV